MAFLEAIPSHGACRFPNLNTHIAIVARSRYTTHNARAERRAEEGDDTL